MNHYSGKRGAARKKGSDNLVTWMPEALAI